MKMRVLHFTPKGKVITMATAISESQQCGIDVIPPAYSCDRERLVILCLTLSKDVEDSVSRFCRELNKDRAQHVAILVDGKINSPGLKTVKDSLEAAGTKLIGEIHFVDGGLPFKFAKKISLEERQAVVKWAEDVVALIK